MKKLTTCNCHSKEHFSELHGRPETETDSSRQEMYDAEPEKFTLLDKRTSWWYITGRTYTTWSSSDAPA